MGLEFGSGGLFGRSDQRDQPYFTKGATINVVSLKSGVGGPVTTTVYTVPVGKKFVAYLVFMTANNDISVTGTLTAKNNLDLTLFVVDKSGALNEDFLGGTPAIFNAGSYFEHSYETNNGAAVSSYSIMGQEIDDE